MANVYDEVKKSVTVLQKGGIILYPTDTIWGIGCDATDVHAVQKIIRLKLRSPEKSFVVLVSSISMLERYVKDIPAIAYDLIDLTERPLTIVFSKPQYLPNEILASDGSIAVRVVRHPFCQKLIDSIKKPIISTSANLANEPSPPYFSAIDDTIKLGVDYIVDIDRDVIEPRQVSIIMKIESNGKFEFLRK